MGGIRWGAAPDPAKGIESPLIPEANAAGEVVQNHSSDANTRIANFIPLQGIEPQILAVQGVTDGYAAEVIDTSMGAAKDQTTAARHNTRPQACSTSWFRSADATNSANGTESDDPSESNNEPLEFIRFQRTIRRPQTSVLQSSALRLPEGGSREGTLFPSEPRSGERERIAPRDALSFRPLHVGV